MNAQVQGDKVLVYVNAWRFDGGAGFDWYYNEADAKRAHAEEQANASAFSSANWQAYFFGAFVSSYDTATDEIDADFDALCDAA